MDHLPYVTARSKKIQVPYYGGIFDDEEWISFPERQGWDVDALLKNDLGDHSPFELTSFLQGWLYLGILCFLTDTEFAIILAQFTKDNPAGTGKVICTQQLPNLLDQLRAIEDKEKLRRNRKWIYRTYQDFNTVLEADGLPIEFVLSMDILFEALCFVILKAHLGTKKSVGFLRNQATSLGDCPATIRIIESLGVSGLYLRYLLGQSKSGHDHNRCSDHHCVPLTNDKDAYRTKPAKTCPEKLNSTKNSICGCQVIEVDKIELRNILQSGCFPLVSIEGAPGALELKVTPFKPGLKYIAISHVIADGMGNFSANALPACRLLDLRDLLKKFVKIYESGELRQYFWLDTLCVPIKGTEGRNVALKRMRSSYSEASAVLVLDAELRQITPRSFLEAALWIIRSAWATRFWTLEEVILARCAFVLFSDAYVAISNIVTKLCEMEAKTYDWCRGLSRIQSTIFAWTRWTAEGENHSLTASTAFRYSVLLVGLKGRSTSSCHDEPFCLASILNLPVDRIVQAEPDDGMMEFWLAQREVPVRLLFAHGRRLSMKGLRWAPASLLQMAEANIDGLDMGDSIATITENGLRFNGSGIRFHSPPPERRLEWPLNISIRNYKELALLNFFLIPTVTMLGECGDLRWDSMSTLAVVLPPGESFKTSILERDMNVVLLSITSETDQVIYGKYIGLLLAKADPTWRDRITSSCPEASYIEIEWLVS